MLSVQQFLTKKWQDPWAPTSLLMWFFPKQLFFFIISLDERSPQRKMFCWGNQKTSEAIKDIKSQQVQTKPVLGNECEVHECLNIITDSPLSCFGGSVGTSLFAWQIVVVQDESKSSLVFFYGSLIVHSSMQSSASVTTSPFTLPFPFLTYMGHWGSVA